MSQQWPGIPTADQEALQAPSFDPVTQLSLAAVLGPAAATKAALQSGILWALGSPITRAFGKYTQPIIDNGVISKQVLPAYQKAGNAALSTNEDSMPVLLRKLQQALYGLGSEE